MADQASTLIPMQVRSAEPPPAMSNPLSMLGTIAQTQGALANAQRAQVEAQQSAAALAARQRAGQIMATAPSLEEGIKALQVDPQVAGFTPEIASTMASLAQTQLQTQGLAQGQTESGLKTLIQASMGAINNPEMLGPMSEAAFATMSPEAKARLAPAWSKMMDGLTAGLPSDPAQAQAVMRSRFAGMMMGSGIAPSTIRSAMGQVEPGVTMAPTGPGGAQQMEVVTSPVGGSATAQPMTRSLSDPGVSSQSVGVVNGQLAPPVRGLSKDEETRLAAQGTLEGQQLAEANESSKIFPQLYQINMMEKALSSFQSGGLANLRGEFGQTLQGLKNMGLDISQSTIDGIANGDIAAQQTFDAEIKRFALAQLKDVAQGRFLKNEVDAYIQTLDKENDPRAILNILNQAKQTLAYNYDKGQKFFTFNKEMENGDPNDPASPAYYGKGGFDAWYTRNFEQSKLPAKTPGGLDIGQSTGAGMKGLTPEKTKALDEIFKGGQ